MMDDPTAGFNYDVVKGVVGILTASGLTYGAWVKWFRKDKVESAAAQFDVTALTAGGSMITALQTDVANLRKTMAEADTKWRADMAVLEQRLEDMGKQIDAAILARRAAEETAARLRFQLRSAGMEPVA